jgi:hypothetical protein
MDSPGTPPDDLDVSLRWPGADASDDAPRVKPRRTDETADDEPSPPIAAPVDPVAADEARGPEVAAPGPGLDVQAFAARTDSLLAALASIAVRMDGLTNTMALLRTVVADRLTDYGEQVVRAQAANDRGMEDYRRLQERSIVELQTGLGESEHALRRLERSVAAVAADLDKTGRVMQSQLEQVEHLGHRLEDVADLAAQPPQPDLSAVHERLQQLDTQLDALVHRPDGGGRGGAGTAEILDRLEALSEQTQMLRRRIALRVRTDQGIDPALVDAMADAVVERLIVDRAQEAQGAAGRRRGRRA